MTERPDLPHDHVYLSDSKRRNERKVWLVIALTAAMMVIEIGAGSLFGSMALVADGWHMATHAGAMLITALAYVYSRRHARDRRFTFGTGKLGDLAGFASAIVLALIALLIGWESLVRLANPQPIRFDQAMVVAVLGLAVNLASAWLLRDDHAHHHPGHHEHGHDHGHGHGRDNNLRAAYLHVLADALTSILAIVALLAGRVYGWQWADPAMGIVGALVIARWSVGLMRDVGGILLDQVPGDGTLETGIRETLEVDGDRITDLHVWRIGPGHCAAIIALASAAPRAPSAYKARLSGFSMLSHVTVEVEPVRTPA